MHLKYLWASLVDRLLAAQSPWCKGQGQVNQILAQEVSWVDSAVCSMCCAGQVVLPAAPKILRRLRNIYLFRLSPLKYTPCSSEYPKGSLHLPKFIFSWPELFMLSIIKALHVPGWCCWCRPVIACDVRCLFICFCFLRCFLRSLDEDSNLQKEFVTLLQKKLGRGYSSLGSYGHSQEEELLSEQGRKSVAEAERDCSGEHREYWPPRMNRVIAIQRAPE